MGTKADGGAMVNIPAVTTWELDEQGLIAMAEDYFDPSPLLAVEKTLLR